jgi:cytochrome b involved in lipid metabolism
MQSNTEQNLKLFRLNEISKHNDAKSTWIIIDDLVYDVTTFLVEHPAGEKVILDLAGQDATNGFNDAGHSLDVSQFLNSCHQSV